MLSLPCVSKPFNTPAPRDSKIGVRAAEESRALGVSALLPPLLSPFPCIMPHALRPSSSSGQGTQVQIVFAPFVKICRCGIRRQRLTGTILRKKWTDPRSGRPAPPLPSSPPRNLLLFFGPTWLERRCQGGRLRGDIPRSEAGVRLRVLRVVPHGQVRPEQREAPRHQEAD